MFLSFDAGQRHNSRHPTFFVFQALLDAADAIPSPACDIFQSELHQGCLLKVTAAECADLSIRDSKVDLIFEKLVQLLHGGSAIPSFCPSKKAAEFGCR
jgi:hypothetical protein